MQPAHPPEKVATAFAGTTESLMGAKYVPVPYCGEQPVHGINCMIICKQALAAQGAPKHIVKMVVNSSKQGYSIVQIKAIV